MVTCQKIEFNETERYYSDLLQGKIIKLDFYELEELILCIDRHDVEINTLNIQVSNDGNFIVYVDKPTILYYALLKENL